MQLAKKTITIFQSFKVQILSNKLQKPSTTIKLKHNFLNYLFRFCKNSKKKKLRTQKKNLSL